MSAELVTVPDERSRGAQERESAAARAAQGPSVEGKRKIVTH
jgi:hypothetical protein